MRSASFDTLTYAKKLQEAGFTPRQAEAQAEALRAVVDENLATKHDLKELEGRLLHHIELVRRDIELARRDTVIWLGGIIVAATTVLGVLMKVL
jgi:hypothetical protein